MMNVPRQTRTKKLSTCTLDFWIPRKHGTTSQLRNILSVELRQVLESRDGCIRHKRYVFKCVESDYLVNKNTPFESNTLFDGKLVNSFKVERHVFARKSRDDTTG